MQSALPLLVHRAVTFGILLPLALAAAGCASWDHNRADLVEPINKLVHQDYPRRMAARDPAAVAELCTPEAAAPVRALVTERMRAFDSIRSAQCVIQSLDLDGRDEGVAVVCLRLDGEKGGERTTTWEDQRIACVRTDAGWRIRGVEADAVREATPDAALGDARFDDSTAGLGVGFVQRSCGVPDDSGSVQDFLPGSGLALGDLDGDGVDDLVLVGGREVRVYANVGGRYEDRTEALGIVPLAEGEGRFPLVVDLDGDGWRDVYVGVLAGPSVVYMAAPGGGFFEAFEADTLGLTSSRYAMGAVAADFDRDGDVDLFVGNGGNLLETQPDPIYDARNGTPDQFFVNQGDGTFVDRAPELGMDRSNWALACTSSDYDRDGDVDLFVANDFGFDLLWQNQGDGTFEEVARDVGIRYRGSSMGATFGDVDNDGDVDLFVTGMASNSAWLIDAPGYPTPAPWPVNWLFRPFVLDVVREMFHGNRFYLNRGDGTFAEVSRATWTRNSGWAWGGIFFDYDNDRRLDLYVLNGLISGELKDDL